MKKILTAIFYLPLISALLAFLEGAAYADSQVQNSRDPFSSVISCRDYQLLLKGEQQGDGVAGSCHPLEAFVVLQRDADFRSYLRAILSRASSDSTLHSIARTVERVMLGDEVGAYRAAEIAGMRVSVRLSQSFDEERAVLYSSLLSGVQSLAAEAMCSDSYDCNNLTVARKTSEILGPEFSGLDSLRPDQIIVCLLRSDAYTLPIRDVASSKFFNNCITSHK